MNDVRAMTTDEQVAYILGEESDNEEEDHRKMVKLDTEKAQQLYNRGLSDSSIGIECGVSGQSIHNWREKNGLLANPHKRKPASLEGRKPAKVNQEFDALFPKPAMMTVDPKFEAAVREAEAAMPAPAAEAVEESHPAPEPEPGSEDSAPRKSTEQKRDDFFGSLMYAIGNRANRSSSEIALDRINAVLALGRNDDTNGIRMAQLLLIKEIAGEVV